MWCHCSFLSFITSSVKAIVQSGAIQYVAFYFLLYESSLYVKFGLQTCSQRAILLIQRSSERARGCWHISSTIVNNYDMTVKPYYQL